MIDVVVDGVVASVVLDRPAARNAVPIASWDRLAEAVEEAAARGSVVLLRSAVPGTFCAGADLGEFPALMADPALPPRLRAGMARATAAIAGATVPVIAVLDGGCFGAGVAIALACDLRIAGAGAGFAVPPARLGIGYPQRDIDRLRAVVGAGQAARLLLTGDRIDAAEAGRIGLVEMVVPDAGVAARVMADRIAANAAESVAALRAGLRSEPGGDARFDALFAGKALAARLPRR
ncbi:enoyl-CoA hydratase/isomerase family protein [Sphingomonas montana]|uniref:enoyl-CoA hydratase/isomerase family protein n=1 Tax=Sphingomonas montana TaxID=1843236 RepID=UPI00096C8710|nr:enoyl-CoA hydratase/isomerase family protein [Sphingomonas montana]